MPSEWGYHLERKINQINERPIQSTWDIQLSTFCSVVLLCISCGECNKVDLLSGVFTELYKCWDGPIGKWKRNHLIFSRIVTWRDLYFRWSQELCLQNTCQDGFIPEWMQSSHVEKKPGEPSPLSYSYCHRGWACGTEWACAEGGVGWAGRLAIWGWCGSSPPAPLRSGLDSLLSSEISSRTWRSCSGRHKSTLPCPHTH